MCIASQEHVQEIHGRAKVEDLTLETFAFNLCRNISDGEKQTSPARYDLLPSWLRSKRGWEFDLSTFNTYPFLEEYGLKYYCKSYSIKSYEKLYL